jgi:tRNA(Arg) A34 adenosine deaminase TadA
MEDNISGLMAGAVRLAQEAAAAGEVPVGAVLAGPDGTPVAWGHNEVERQKNPLAHAELLVLMRALQERGTRYLDDCALAVTLEPCAMCAQAIAHARVGTVVFGAYDPKSGGAVNGARVWDFSHHKPEVIGGLREAECAALLKDFFAAQRGGGCDG